MKQAEIDHALWSLGLVNITIHNAYMVVVDLETGTYRYVDSWWDMDINQVDRMISRLFLNLRLRKSPICGFIVSFYGVTGNGCTCSECCKVIQPNGLVGITMVKDAYYKKLAQHRAKTMNKLYPRIVENREAE